MQNYLPPFSLQKWVDEHRNVLKPPVNNKVIYKDNKDYIVMVVGGPNVRTDYHVNHTEELFYMIEGDMVLRIWENNLPKDIPIKEGEMFLLPPSVPHSPQRPANSIGLVIERYRPAQMQDGFQWYCKECHNKLYEEFLVLDNIETQLPLVFDRFWSSADHTTCKKCGSKHVKN